MDMKKQVSRVAKKADVLGWTITRFIWLGSEADAGFIVCKGASHKDPELFSVHSFNANLYTSCFGVDFHFGVYDLTASQATELFNTRVKNALEA